MAKYLDYDGLKKVWAKIKTVDNNGNLTGGELYKVLNSAKNYSDDKLKKAVENRNGEILTINTEVSNLKSYFSSGIAKKATADASGNTITTTYATKTELATAKSNLIGTVNDDYSKNTIQATKTKIDSMAMQISELYTKTDGVSKAFVFDSITNLMTGTLVDNTDVGANNNIWNIGDSVYVADTNTPDFWISKVTAEPELSKTVSTASEIKEAKTGAKVTVRWSKKKVVAGNTVQANYIVTLVAIETKMDLSGYVTNSALGAFKETLGNAAYKNVSTAISNGDGNPATSAAVYTYVTNMFASNVIAISEEEINAVCI